MQMLPWFIVTALGGCIVGILLGAAIASALVKGHYTHFLSSNTNQQQVVPPQVVYTRPRGYDPHYDDGYYTPR